MAKRQEDLDRGRRRDAAGAPGVLGTKSGSRVTRGVTRPVWEPDAGGQRCAVRIAGSPRALAIHDQFAKFWRRGRTGILPGAMGIPTLDGLGVAGAGAHTLDEHIQIESLAYRGKLLAGLLMALA